MESSEAVTNSELTGAIAEAWMANGPQTANRLSSLLRKARFLVPALTEAMHAIHENADGRVTIEQASAMTVLLYKDDDGASFLPLFTDHPSLKSWTDRQVAPLMFEANEAWQFVLSQPLYQGAVVNPGQHGFQLTRLQIQELRDGGDA